LIYKPKTFIMKRIATILFVLTIVACNEPKVDKEAEGKKLMQLSREWSKAASSGDLEKTLSYWGQDAVLISAGQAPLNGKPAIRQMVEESFRMPGFRISWEPQSVQVSEGGDMAYIIENSQVSFKDSGGTPTVLHNKAVSVWRKQDGTWKNVVDISTPLPSQGNNQSR
jgi:uncharacterized protein (TIGR02246 family)